MEDISLQQARNDWRETIHGSGGKCPCCNRWGKTYYRNINNTMAKALSWLGSADCISFDSDWVDVPNTAPSWVLRSNQLSTLRWWGLVTRATREDFKTNWSGLWRITDYGAEFLQGNKAVPKSVFTYNGDVVGTSTEEVYIKDCLKEKFDYGHTMTATYGELN
jgi:hypothetical protein